MASEAAAGAAAGAWGGQGLRAGRCYHPHTREGGFWLFGEQGAGEHPALGGNTCRKWDDPARPRECGPGERASDAAPDASAGTGCSCLSEGDGGRGFARPFYALNALAVRSSARSAITSGARSQLWGRGLGNAGLPRLPGRILSDAVAVPGLGPTPISSRKYSLWANYLHPNFAAR